MLNQIEDSLMIIICERKVSTSLIFNHPVPIPDEEKKTKLTFYFHILCVAFKAFMKLFEAPQRSVKIKFSLNFYFSTTFRNARGGKG